MAGALAIVAFLLFGAFIIGMIKPSWVLFFGQPSRGRVALLFLLPSIVFFMTSGFMTNKQNEENWNNPEGVVRLNLYKKGFKEIPEKVVEFQDMEELYLKDNEISILNKEILTALPKLKTLNLENNPISELPIWLKDLNLNKLVINGTQVDSISPEIKSAIDKISYEDTPLSEKEAAIEAEANANIERQEGESFSEFALRKLIGKEFGYDKRFLKGRLFYTKAIDDEKVEQLGNYLQEQGYFNDEREIAMQISYNDRKEVQAYELKAVYALEEELSEDLKFYFKLLAKSVSDKIFEGKPVHFHLTDDQFDETKYLLKSDD